MAEQKIPPLRIKGNLAYVPLTKGLEAIIDADDVPTVANRKWVALVCKRATYAVNYTRQDGRSVATLMHRLILNAPPGSLVDHVNGNGLDNVRSNIRLATAAQNAHNQKLSSANRSGVKGVGWNARAGKWIARIMKDGAHRYLGLFDSIEAAEAAVTRAREDLHGEFARRA